MPKGRIAEEDGQQSTSSEKQARWEEVLRGERLTQVAAIAQYPDKLNEPRVRRIPRQLALSPPQEGVGPKGAGRAWARDVWTYKTADVAAAVASLEPIQRRPRTHKPWNRKRPPSCFPAYYPKRGKTDDDDESGAPSDAGFLALDVHGLALVIRVASEHYFSKIPVEKRTVGHMFGAATEATPMDRHAALAMAYNLMSRYGAGCDFNNDGNVEANEAHAVKTLIQSMPVLRDESRSPQSRLVYAYERAFAPDAAAGDAASEGGSSLHRAQEPPTIETKPPPRKHGATRLRHARAGRSRSRSARAARPPQELHLGDVIMRESSEAADIPLCGVGSCNVPFVNDVSSFHGPADDDGGYM